VISCPSNRRFECGEPIDFGQATATDNCDTSVGITFSDSRVPGGNPGEYEIERTWIATDDCGNSATCLQTVTVTDGAPPIITCPNDARFECDETVEFGQATATDDCDPAPVITYDDETVPGRCGQQYDIVRTWIATDASGNSSTCVQTVTVFDATPPEITCPPDDEFEFGQTILFGDPTVDDNCDATVDVTHSDQQTIGVCPQTYTIVRTWVATDDCGNAASCQQTITVHDETPPEITCPDNRVFECNQAIEFGQATATDVGDPNPAITYNDVVVPGNCSQAHTIMRVWIATDDCGNSATCVQTVQVVDTHAPVITCPSDRRFNCDQPIDFGQATASDSCDAQVAITFSDQTIPGGSPSEYQVRRTWIATDDCGNSSTCLQTVTVMDLTPPTITCPGNRTFECTEPVVFGEPTATDNCDTQLTITYSDQIVPGSSPQQYQIRRTWRAADDGNNTAECLQIVSVVDRTAPVLTPVPSYTVACNAPVVFDVPQATDNCDPNPVVSISSTTVEPGPGPCEYTHTRCYIATDASGNSSSALCQVIIQPVDTEAPVVTCAPDKEITEGDPIIFDEPTVTDNCPMEPELRASPPLPDGAVAQAETSYTRCWTAVDLCGNVSEECCQTITVAARGPQFCTFTCYIWTSACLEDPNREISTTPACVRDDYFDDVFPNGLVIGSHSAPGRYTATFTSAMAVETFKCGYGLPAALTRDYVDPARVQLGSIYGEILALRLNREFSCGDYFQGWGFPDSIACFGSYVVPPEVPRFAGITVDQLLAIADAALSGNTSVLVPYGNSMLRLQGAAAYMNWLFGNCAGAERPVQPPFLMSNIFDRVDDGQATPDASIALPDKFGMTSQPNPLRSSVTLSLAMPAAGDVSVELYDIQGRKVVTVLREHKAAGYHNVVWNGTDSFGMPVVSGVYFLRVQVDGQLMTMQKLMKL
jgi:hypothetical protein